ncbi:Adaptor protein complex sigma subunit [Hygrophoropsis aurantiaca]|uniref:Adaptor protein complex sigma subunit n=1 Tax=Hygrophoropsis aurantiaca TaxID=72124 RepID=A0ACB7ZXH2_9AGAM|nr:Adaptor protein complex sigma subunit [Hygrophoropsis aurantiaca]
MINYLLLASRQGKVRLLKWFVTMPPKTKAKTVKDVTQLVVGGKDGGSGNGSARKRCNFLEYRDTKVVYRRYASLFFICGISADDNELVTLEIIHRFVEVLDRYFGNVSDPDLLIFNFQQAYAILDELIIAGELQESSKKSVLRLVSQADSMLAQELEDTLTGRLLNEGIL